MLNHLCMALRYSNQAKDYSEALKLAKNGATRVEVVGDSVKYVLADGSAMIDNGSSILADENKWWDK